MTTKKVFKTDIDTILIVTATLDGCDGRSYVSVTANEFQPITKKEAITQVREGLEDGELWRMAVEAKRTEEGLEDWIETVISNDGELAGFDNSLYDEIINIDGEDYIFDSRSCGCLHTDIKEATNEFDGLINLHLKDNPRSLKQAEKMILALQKKEDNDIDFWVEKYTREIIGIDA